VGINLASADTGKLVLPLHMEIADGIVIVYDPDFNPHQDLQVSYEERLDLGPS
jgi:hypothetical protein